MRLLSSRVPAQRAAFGTSAAAAVADTVVAAPEVFADSSWPLVVEIAITSRMSPAMYDAIAAHAREHVEWFTADLTAELRAPSFLDYTGRSRIVLRVLGLDATGLAQPIATALEHELSAPLSNAQKLVAVLGYVGDKNAVPVLVAALNHSDWTISIAACMALARLGPEAKPAEGDLERVAQHHWLQAVRRSAGLAKRFIVSGCRKDERVPFAKDQPWTTVYDALVGDSVVDGAFRLIDPPASTTGSGRRPVERCAWKGRYYQMIDEEPILPERLQGTRWKSPDSDTELVARGSSGWLRVPDGDLVAINSGEFGAVVLHVGSQGRIQPLDAGNVRWLVATSRGFVAISGIAHLGQSVGQVYRLAQRNGEWQAEGLARLPGAPLSYALAADDTLLISTEASEVRVETSGRIASDFHCE